MVPNWHCNKSVMYVPSHFSVLYSWTAQNVYIYLFHMENLYRIIIYPLEHHAQIILRAKEYAALYIHCPSQ